MRKVFTAPDADLFTPYGATESLPVASIGAGEVLQKTAERTRQGGGTCVGRRFEGVDVRIIEITEGPIANLSDARELPPNEIGEIIVRGPSVTREYYQRPEATALAKIGDGDTFWHRIGDVGYLDDEGLLWFCGRKAHIVETEKGRMFSVRCEAIFNEHPDVYRSALVGLGERPHQTPVVVVEPEAAFQQQFGDNEQRRQQLKQELLELGAASPLTAQIRDVRLHPAFPVDTRHNVKINREALADWVKKNRG